MSVIRNYGNITFECDECGKTLETGIDGIYDAYQHAKGLGWRAVKTGNCWEHRCPGCNREG
jgi:hypothetical protein